jgi:uncharacterized protein
MKLDLQTLALDLSSIRSGSSTSTFTLPMPEIDWGMDDIRPLDREGVLDLTVTVREATWICRGSLSAEFVTPCARCLEPAPFPVEAPVYRIFTWDENLADDLDTELVPGRAGEVDILDAVREAVILSVPGLPLCRGDCRGLCAECGRNLNIEECEHSRAAGLPGSPSESE